MKFYVRNIDFFFKAGKQDIVLMYIRKDPISYNKRFFRSDSTQHMCIKYNNSWYIL